MPTLLSWHVVISVLRWDILLRAVSPRRISRLRLRADPLAHQRSTVAGESTGFSESLKGTRVPARWLSRT
jgi:hypothetical protein